MSQRFFSQDRIDSSRVRLAGAEAHHLLHVMRLGVGAEVVLFDGSGWEFRAQVARTGRADVELDVLDRAQVDRELAFDLTLGVALPKGDRQRWLVEKLVELGVTRMIPLRTERSVAQPKSNALDRLRRAVIEASKQCGRNRLAEITEPMNWADFIEFGDDTAPRWMAHPGGRAVRDLIETENPVGGNISLAVGPEGGFAEDEVSAGMQRGWQSVDLGPRILRIETAALALVVAVGV